MTISYADVADRAGTTWRQGDIYVARVMDGTAMTTPAVPLTGHGHKVVSDRNSHILHGDGSFHPGSVIDDVVDYGLLVVPDGGLAVLTHTGDDGSVAFGPGAWRLWRGVS